MEKVLHNISNTIIYIDDFLVHTKTHKDHLKVLDHELEWLQQNNLNIKLDKCFFSNKEVLFIPWVHTHTRRDQAWKKTN